MLKTTICALTALVIALNIGFIDTPYVSTQDDLRVSGEYTLITPLDDNITIKMPNK